MEVRSHYQLRNVHLKRITVVLNVVLRHVFFHVALFPEQWCMKLHRKKLIFILTQHSKLRVFSPDLNLGELPVRFNNPFEVNPHSCCIHAMNDLKDYLKNQFSSSHNFGLLSHQEGEGDGKMFGVLVVRTEQNKIGYLSAFSGKLAGVNHHDRFVPPVFDSLDERSFLNTGMRELGLINSELKSLENSHQRDSAQIEILKQRRKAHSLALSNKLYDSYSFINILGESKNLREIFEFTSTGNPPGGAGECAAPKLLQYAFQHRMTPLSMAEFWWGESLRTDQLIHGHCYPSCRDKCRPILNHMLKGLDVQEDG